MYDTELAKVKRHKSGTRSEEYKGVKIVNTNAINYFVFYFCTQRGTPAILNGTSIKLGNSRETFLFYMTKIESAEAEIFLI